MATDRPTFPKHRVEALTDGVFAIAATLLVLDVTTDGLGPVRDSAALWRGLTDLGPELTSFAISFLLLCLLWANQLADSRALARIDGPLLALTSVRLLGVVLVPFTTSLDTGFSDLVLGRVLLPVNVLVISAAGACEAFYATSARRDLLAPGDPAARRTLRAGALSAVLISAAVVGLSAFVGSLAFLLFAGDGPLSRLLAGAPRPSRGP